MAGHVSHHSSSHTPASGPTEGLAVRCLLIGLALLFVGLFLLLPLASVFAEAFGRGLQPYLDALRDPRTLASLRLTVLLAAIVVPLNTVFGIAAAWAITRFRFPGKPLLVTLIDLPFAISPVVVGVMLLVLFGAQGYFGPWLREHDFRIVFALPGMVLATLFVTIPFVARELIPLMQSRGLDLEEAALTLGASGWQTFWYVTLPGVRWAVLYGVILANARAMGEFGAVYVVSKPVPGEIPLALWVDTLNSEHQGTAAFAVASLLTFVAIATLVVKAWLESRQHREMVRGQSSHTE